jgi:hypothetical protein
MAVATGIDEFLKVTHYDVRQACCALLDRPVFRKKEKNAWKGSCYLSRIGAVSQ